MKGLSFLDVKVFIQLVNPLKQNKREKNSGTYLLGHDVKLVSTIHFGENNKGYDAILNNT